MSTRQRYPQVKNLASTDALVERLDELGLSLPVAAPPDAGQAMAAPLTTAAGDAPNRWAILPMEGWDATEDGRPTELLRRRWRRFGASGAGLLWGCEAVAVAPAGRANPRQLMIGPSSADDLSSLREDVRTAADEAERAQPVVGLQLTHAGRFARPHGEPAPRTAYEHGVLDQRVGAQRTDVLDDDELEELVDGFVAAAVVAHEAGFDFVDVKSCHGYLFHELLTARGRPGPFGGDLDGRTALLRRTVGAIRAAVPSLAVGVRLSLFDVGPWRSGDDGVGVPDVGDGEAIRPFGSDGSTDGIDLAEPHDLLSALEDLGVAMVCTSAGSPYYNPHVQRPAYFAPSDGYAPPEDPLVGVVRLLQAARAMAEAHPTMPVIAAGVSYLQEHVADVAAALVGEGWASAVGIGRMALSYPDLPADALAGRPLERRAICRTFSDCTTAPRNGLVSGCYPLDADYRAMPERLELAAVKRSMRQGRAAPDA